MSKHWGGLFKGQGSLYYYYFTKREIFVFWEKCVKIIQFFFILLKRSNSYLLWNQLLFFKGYNLKIFFHFTVETSNIYYLLEIFWLILGVIATPNLKLWTIDQHPGQLVKCLQFYKIYGFKILVRGYSRSWNWRNKMTYYFWLMMYHSPDDVITELLTVLFYPLVSKVS